MVVTIKKYAAVQRACVVLLAVVAVAFPVVSASAGSVRLLPVAHDGIKVDPTVRRWTGTVVSIGDPDAKGRHLTFRANPIGPRNFPLAGDDLRGWRMTVLAGKRFGETFTIGGNTAEADITVSAERGSLDGLAANDVFIIESVDANGASLFPAQDAQPAGNT
jgi:hypothetical protein